jgi:hypothetical protein
MDPPIIGFVAALDIIMLQPIEAPARPGAQ